MEQHPVPRQITTFEFKLIGFMTVRQFIYLIIFIPLGLIVFFLFPIPLLNFLFGAIVAGLGFALAFLPVYDRPLDVWIINLYKRLVSPTQYLYQKNNPPIYFLTDLPVFTQSQETAAHIQSQSYLNQYLQKTTPPSLKNDKKQNINQLFFSPLKTVFEKKEKKSSTPILKDDQNINLNQVKTPFLTGVVKNHKLIPLSGILIYVKNEKGEVLRLLKTNPHGVFATFNPLSDGEYLFEIKDPKNLYIFDTMKIRITQNNNKPLEFYSKELL